VPAAPAPAIAPAPVVPEPGPVVLPAAAAPAPAALPARPPRHARESAPSRLSRQTIRVARERLDGLMGLVGELVVARSALERRLAELERLGDVLFTSRARLAQSVTDFERKHMDARLPARRDEHGHEDGSTRHRSVAELFAELEFDRYDDFTL